MRRLTPLQRKQQLASDSDQIQQDAAVLTEQVRKPPKINPSPREVRRAAKIRMRRVVEFLIDHERESDLSDVQIAALQRFGGLAYRKLPNARAVRV